ncbi:DUF3015 family protein [Thiomicrospira microaerophila]|uniref:DUF3015 family protein n=1 Tax=Thiomicrospira microaerophila TaxID=406020 RepID=UPI00200C6385|nr:DUF3015 family protein [Thiomicrospira microaerophila]UQB43004.1 DUF3015 family protein [Thiomicrospira microaerophila]
MKKLGLAVALASLSSVAIANPNTGCGLGSMIIEDQSSVLMQVLAVTTNGTSGNQTFGITSGTLGCAKPANLVSNEQMNQFVANNIDSLAVDIAAGQGEALDTLAVIMNVEDKAAFASKLQANFSNLFSSEELTSAALVDNIIAVVG